MPTPLAPTDRSPTLREMERVISTYLAENYPDAIACTVLVTLADETGATLKARLPVRLGSASTGNPLADAVLGELARLAPGEWARGADLAAAVGLEYTGGRFRVVMAALKAQVESGRKGYRLKPAEPESDGRPKEQ